ncbi:unnamed protein product [Protopolystoma xenopodis]|uniref:Uncharacterized protein n=1 Tax=Protopolystoma xenopodis TaxID=117903 RepID=A0A3S5C673_9PLAT|nr:unnamed protein product [Protopolystoma xenopodis]
MAEIALPKAIDVFPASISGPEVTKSSALVDIVTSDNDKSSDCSFHIETPLASETGIKNRRYSSRNANVRKKTALPKNDSTTNSKELDSNLECSKLVQTQCDSLSNERMARSQRAHRLIRIYFSEDDVGKPLQSSCEETLRPSETFILGDAVMPHASGRVENNHDSVKIDWFIWPPALTERQIEIIRVRVREFLHMHAGSIEAGQLTGRTMANIFHGIGTPIFPAQAWSKSHRFWRSQLGMDWPTIRRIATEEILIAASDFRL